MQLCESYAMNVALGKPTVQSSNSLYQRICTSQGLSATNGAKTGSFSFHTEVESFPWWIVDLLAPLLIQRVVVFNREDDAADRIKTLTISVAREAVGPWVSIHQCAEAFGGALNGSPLDLTLDPPILVRYVRLHLNEKTALHVDEVEIYGGLCPTSAVRELELIYSSENAITTFPSASGGMERWCDVWNWSLFRRRYNVENAESIRFPAAAQVLPSITVQPNVTFDGEIKTLRLVRYGRFGNNFYQLWNSTMLARVMNCSSLEIPEIDDGPDNLPIRVDELRIAAHSKVQQHGATLAGNFYWPSGMEAILGPYSTVFALDTVRRFVNPLYKKYHSACGSLGPHTLVMHFRGGDIFSPGINAPWYVQPPASYYIRAFEFAVLRLAISAVHLVFEDKTNPAVDVVIDYLSGRGICYSYQSSSLFEDAITVMSGHHIVAGYGTFCEAIGLMSNVIETYFGFRQISSQKPIEFWGQSRIEDVLRQKGVRMFIIDDPDRSYTPQETWDNSSEQLSTIRSYPIQKLRLMERL
jgi:hypothetical protein